MEDKQAKQNSLPGAMLKYGIRELWKFVVKGGITEQKTFNSNMETQKYENLQKSVKNQKHLPTGQN